MQKNRTLAGFLVVLSPPELEGKIQFYYGENTVGRSAAKSSIVIHDNSVSQRHATITATSEGVTLRDNGSKNGTKLNGEENLLQKDKEEVISESMFFFFADVKCRIELASTRQSKKTGKAIEQKVQKEKNRKQVMEMFDDDSEGQEVKKKGGAAKEAVQEKPVKDEFKKTNFGEFDIDQDFENQAEKESKALAKAVQMKKGKNKTAQSKEDLLKLEKPDKKSKKTDKQAHPEPKKVDKDKIVKSKKEKEGDNTVESITNLSKVEDVIPAQSTKPIPSKKDKKKKSPPQKSPLKKSPVKSPAKVHQITFSKSPPAKNIPNKSKQVKSKKQAVIPVKEEKLQRRSERLSASSAQKNSNESKLSVPTEFDKRNTKKNAESKEQKGKGQAKSKNKSLGRSQSPPRQEDKIKIKVTKPPVASKGSRIPRDSLANIKQVETEVSTTKKKMNRKKLPDNFSHDSNKYSEIMIIPPRPQKKGRRVMFSNCSSCILQDFFKLVLNEEEQFDFLVMDSYSRTFKALLAITKGIPIVSRQWLKSCQSLKMVFNGHSFCLPNIQHIYQAIDMARNQVLFKGIEFYLASNDYHMQNKKIQALIKAGGGKLMKKITTGQKKDQTIVLVRNKTEKHMKEYTTELRTAKKQGFEKIYTIQFLLDSCQKQEIDWSTHHAVL